MDAALRQKIYHFIETNGLRRTVQREAIIEAVFTTTEHFSADELLARARAIEPTVSRATIYRTLPLLVRSGFLNEIDFGKEQKFYDPNVAERPRHHHLICLDCHRIIEFEDPKLEALEESIAKRLGFTATSKLLRIEARCDQFQKHGACKHRA